MTVHLPPDSANRALAGACDNERVDRGRAEILLVRDAMIIAPKTVAADATVDQLRSLFANPHVATALIVDGTRFVGCVERDQVTDSIAGDTPARALATRRIPTVEPDTPLTDALSILDAQGDRRLVVLDPAGSQLRGLPCLTVDRHGFCKS
jgi:CBS domain-containing protein